MPYKDRDKRREWERAYRDAHRATPRAVACACCSEPIVGKRSTTRYCSGRCRRRINGLKWDAANPDKKREKIKRWRAAHRDKVREDIRRWSAANPERRLDHSRARSLRKQTEGLPSEWHEIAALKQRLDIERRRRTTP